MLLTATKLWIYEFQSNIQLGFICWFDCYINESGCQLLQYFYYGMLGFLKLSYKLKEYEFIETISNTLHFLRAKRKWL